MKVRERKYDEIRVGDRASLSKTITEEDIKLFAQATGDYNPLHLDEEFARNSFFKERIAHGMLTAGLISAVLGTELPGANTIYLSQQLRFLAPVKIGDTIKAECEVIEKRDDKKILTMRTTVTNQHQKVVVEGEAKVMKWEE